MWRNLSCFPSVIMTAVKWVLRFRSSKKLLGYWFTILMYKIPNLFGISLQLRRKGQKFKSSFSSKVNLSLTISAKGSSAHFVLKLVMVWLTLPKFTHLIHGCVRTVLGYVSALDALDKTYWRKLKECWFLWAAVLTN